MHRRARILAAATAAHGLVGILVATAVPGPLLAVDDLAHLSLGRTLAGGGASPLGAQAPYGLLYPMLLAPGWAIGLDESQLLVWARVVNAMLGAALVPVLYVLVRRITQAGFGRSLVSALIGASLPAALLTGSIVWTERLLPLLVALAALLLVRIDDNRPRDRLWEPTGLPGETRVSTDVVAAGAVAVALFAAHPRMAPVSIVVLVAIATKLFRQGRPRAAALSAGAGLGALGAVEVLARWLATATFGEPGTYDAFDLASRRGVDEIPRMAVHSLGTVAYLGLATAGLAVIGAIVLWRSRSLRVPYLTMLVAVVAASGWFLTGVGRSDAYLHGRYIEVMAPLLVALGVVGIREITADLTLRIAGISIVIAGLYGAWAGPGDNWSRPRSPVMMLGTEVGGAPFGGDVFEPGAATTVAIVAGALLIVTARAHAGRAGIWMLAATASAVIALGVLSGLAALDSLHQGSAMGQVEVALAEVEITGLAIDTDRVPTNVAGAAAWTVGFDRVTGGIGEDTSHVLWPSDAPAPPDSTLVVELGPASLWSLG